MRGTLVLVGHSLKRVRAMLVALAVLLFAFQFLLTQVAGYLQRRSAFSALSALMPDFVRTLAGPSSLAFLSFSGVVGLGYFHPIVMTSLVGVAIAIATEPAAEVEHRFVDLSLARPIARTQVITRTVIVTVVATASIVAMMALGTWTGLACCTAPDVERPSAALVASLAANLTAVALCWSGVALAAAAGVRRRAVAGAVAGGAALAAYLLDYLGRAWEPAGAASRLSPFHYFEPMSLVLGEPLRAWNLSVLLGVAAAGTMVAYVVFARRDI
jgi:ABC-2 type transport system permease protein